MPLVVLDDYLIRKGNGVFNIHEFIQAMLGSNSIDEGYAALSDKHHDLNHDNFAGVEADAVKMAISQGIGGLTPQEVATINQGEAANPQAWHQAFQKAVNAGAPIINEAINKTNEINRQKGAANGIVSPEIPLAFTQDMGNYVAVQAWRTPVLGIKGQGSHNAQGALITQYISKNTKKAESYARPYSVGLQALRKEKYPDLKVPNASDEISPTILHADTLYLKDPKLRAKFGLTVQGIRDAYPTANPEQLQFAALQALRGLPEFKKFGGIAHSGGLDHGIHSEEAMGQRMIEHREANANSRDSLLQFIAPEMRGHAINNTTGHSYYHNENPSKKMLSMYEKHYGWDEETSKRVHQNAYSGKYDGMGMNRAEQLMAAKRDELMAGGKPPEWAGDAVMPKGAAIGSPVDEQQPASRFTPNLGVQGGMPSTVAPPQQDLNTEFGGGAPKTPIQEAVQQPPSHLIRPDPEPAKPNAAIHGAIPTPVRPEAPAPPMASQQKPPSPPMQSLNAYPSPPVANQKRGKGFLDNLMTRLGYGYETLFPSFGKSDDMTDEQVLKEMLENVQLEIAKKEVMETTLTKSPRSISSISDVTTIGNSMKRPNSDIVSIYHSRGDWENVAKAFGMTHNEVQTVKVIFNE